MPGAASDGAKHGITRRCRTDAVCIVDACFVFFGLWTITVNAVVALSGSFRLLIALAIVPLLASTLVILKRPTSPLAFGSSSPSKPAARPTLLPWPIKLLLAAADVVLLAWTGNVHLFWSIGMLLLALNALEHRDDRLAPVPKDTPRAIPGPVWALAAAAAAFVLTVHGSSIDDAFYLNVINSAIDQPDRPLLQFDAMHGIAGLPILMPAYSVVSFEPLIACLSWFSRLEPATVYYVLVPPLMAILVVIIHWVTLRLFLGAGALTALVISVALMMAWRQMGSNLYAIQYGKTVLVSAAVPALVFFALRFGSRPTVWHALVLTCGQIAAVGISANGMIIGPLAAGVSLLASCGFDRRGLRRLACGLATGFYPVFALTLVAIATRSRGQFDLGQDPGWLTRMTRTSSVAYVDMLAVFAAALIPVPAATRRLRAFWVLAAFAIPLNPLFSALMATFVTSNMSWRILWAIPMPLVVGIAGACCATALARRPAAALASAGAAAAVIVAAFIELRPHMSDVTLGFARRKVGREMAVAERAAALTDRGGLVLADEVVSSWIATLRQPPRLVVVRRRYTVLMSNDFGPAEAQTRLRLFDLVDSRTDPEPDRVATGLTEIVARGVDTVVIAESKAVGRKSLIEGLAALGYRVERVDHYEIWHKLATGHHLTAGERPRW
jgi:hypothetical protein